MIEPIADMLRYVTTVTSSPRLSHAGLVSGGRQVIAALEYMHSKKVAHLDVKGDNVFLDQPGQWWLGDFGSARSFADDSTHTVVTTTRVFYPFDLRGTKPGPYIDWYMLSVMLCLANVDAKHLTSTFGSPVSDKRLRDYVNGLADYGSGLKAVLVDLLGRHDSV